MAGLDQPLVDLLAGAPELQQNPGLTVGMAQGLQASQTPLSGGPDPYGVGQATSYALATQGHDQALSEIQKNSSVPVSPTPSANPHSKNKGFWGSVKHFFGHDVLAPVGNALNQPLQGVQHTYRYIHDVWERHGVLQAIDEMAIAASAGIVAYGTTGNAEAAVLAGEGAAYAYGRGPLGNEDSWKATQDGATYRDPHNGEVVSPGRDLANLVDHLVNGRNYAPGNLQVVNGVEQPKPGGGIDTPTGALNAVFDLNLDPMMRVGKLTNTARKTGVFYRGTRGVTMGDKTILAGRIPRPLIQPDGTKGSDIYDIAAKNAGVRDAFQRIAGMDTAQVVRNYPMLAPVAKGLGQAQSVDEVAQVFDQAITARNYSFIRYGVPTTTLTRRALGKVGVNLPTPGGLSSGIQDAFSRTAKNPNDGTPLISSVTGMPVQIPWGPGKVVNAFTSYQSFAFNSQTLAISGKQGDPMDPEFLRGLYSVLRHSQNAATSQAILARYIDADSLGERINIITNSYRDAMRASGLPDTAPFSQKSTADLNYLAKVGTRRVYAVDMSGKPISMTDENGNLVNRGVFANQTGEISFPDFSEWKRSIASTHGTLWNKAAGLDDWLNSHITTKFFKRLVLLSLGFAFRVSAGELIPAILQNDARRVLGSGLAAASAKLNPDFSEIVSEIPKGEAGDHPLIGVRALTTGRKEVGYIKDFDANAGKATVEFPTSGETSMVPFDQVTAYHADIPDEEIKQAAREYGVQVSADEIPHYKAALGKALYGVSRALVDDDYRKVALMNLMANDGHVVAPGLTSDHAEPHSMAGISEDVRKAVYRTGILASPALDKKVMGDSWRLWDAEDASHPLFWHYALNEAAQDVGIRKAARAFLDTYNSGGPINVLDRSLDVTNELPQGGQLVPHGPQVMHQIELTDAERQLYATEAARRADLEFLTSDHPQAVHMSKDMAHFGKSPEQYAALRSEALKGLVFGRNGKLNQDILEDLARGDTTSIGELAQREPAFRPVAVKGRTIEDAPAVGPFERVVQAGWRTFIHPTINSLSRAPIWTMLTTDEYKFFKPWVDEGLMTPNEAHSIAQVRALNRMLPLIHNTLLRNQFAISVRNIAPFYFAQEQAYKRYGRVIFTDPAAFREAQLMYHGLVSSGALQSDPQGNHYIVYPGHGDLSFLATLAMGHLGINTLSGVPGSISGDTISLRSVVPEMNGPSVAPTVAIPLKEIAKHFPQADPFVHAVLGNVSYNSSMAAELIPNTTLRRAWEALDPEARSLAFGSAFSQNAAYAAHKALNLWQQAEKIDRNAMEPNFPRDQLKPEARALLAQADNYLPLPGSDPNTAKHAMDRLRNTTRIQLLTKTLFGAVSPLSPVMKVGDVQLDEEFRADIGQYGVAKGIQTFMDKHPDATPDTVFMSNNAETGTNPPATKAALDWVTGNRGWIDHNLLAAAYLTPQSTGKFDSQAYNQELSMGLRQRRTPQQFVDAIYTAEGNAEYIPSLKDYETALSQANDSYAKQQLHTAWQNYLNDLRTRNPVWYDNQFNPAKQTTAQRAYEELVNAANDPHTPATPMMPVVKDLISSYQDYQRAEVLQQAGQLSMTKSQLSQAWRDYIDQVVTQHPEAQAVAYGVFRRLGSSA